MNIDVENALRAEFTSRAAQLTCGPVPYPGLERRIARRRHASAAGVAVAATLVATIGVGAGVTLAQHHPGPAGNTVTPAVTGPVIAGGCGTTPLYRGHPPAWTAPSRAPADLPYVVSSQGNAVGFLFAAPLRAGTRTDTQNKILWVIRTGGEDTGYGPLTIATQPVGSPASAVLRHDEPGIGGGSYPSITDVTTPGCWHFTLSWAGGTATADLPYSPNR